MSWTQLKDELNALAVAGLPILASLLILAACSPSSSDTSGTTHLAVSATPNRVTVAQNQSVTMRVDIPGLAPGQNIPGYSINLPETAADIDIATQSCPSGVGTSACQDWTITPGSNSVPGFYNHLDIMALGVTPAGFTLTVTANPRDPLPGAIAVDAEFNLTGSSGPSPKNVRQHVLFVTSDRRLWGFGENISAQVRGGYLRNGSPTAIAQPSRIDEPVAVGQSTFRWRFPFTHGNVFGQSFAVRDDGTVWGWGFNQFGELGFLSQPSDLGIQLAPSQLPGISNIVAITTDGELGMLLDSAGQVYVWLGRSGLAPNIIPNLSNVLQVAGGFRNPYIRTADGHVRTISSFAVLGDVFGVPVDSIAAGANHLLAIQAQQILAFGKNDEGQLGDGTLVDRPCDLRIGPCVNPASALVGTAVSAIAARGNRSFALATDGTVWTWGAGILSPVQVPGLNNVQIIGAGFAIRGDCTFGGSLWEISFGEDGTSPPTAARVPRVGETPDCTPNTFALTLGDASLMLAAGNDQRSTVLNLARDGYLGAVDLTVVDCPANVLCTPNPDPVPSGASAGTLTIATTNATPGNYVITFRGIGGGITSEAFLELLIQ